jgi:NTP pyrophosphatase (non-canonical NTP hydrolase)
MDFQNLLGRAIEIRQQYAALEEASHGRAWSRDEVAMGFVGDVGDLMKLLMALGGIRRIPDAKQKLTHELADCLWSILVLSHLYDVDLEHAFLQTMDDLEQQIAAQRSVE